MELLEDKKATAYPTYAHLLPHHADEGWVWDPPFLTGKSAAYAFDFALELIRILRDEPTADAVAKAIVYNG